MTQIQKTQVPFDPDGLRLVSMFRDNSGEVTSDRVFDENFGSKSFLYNNDGLESRKFLPDIGYTDPLMLAAEKEEKKTELARQSYKTMFDTINGDWKKFYNFDLISFSSDTAFLGGSARDIYLSANHTVRDSAGSALYIDADSMCLNPDYTANRGPDEVTRKEAAARPLDLSQPETLKRVETSKVLNEYGDVSDGQQCLAPVEGERIMQAKTLLSQKAATTNTDPAVLKFHEGELVPYGQGADFPLAMERLVGARSPGFTPTPDQLFSLTEKTGTRSLGSAPTPDQLFSGTEKTESPLKAPLVQAASPAFMQ